MKMSNFESTFIYKLNAHLQYKHILPLCRFRIEQLCHLELFTVKISFMKKMFNESLPLRQVLGIQK